MAVALPRFLRRKRSIGRQRAAFRDYLALLEREHALAPDELGDRQSARVRELVDHAYRHVPFQRRRLDAAGVEPGAVTSASDLEALEPVTKADLRSVVLSDLLSRPPGSAGTRERATSGSSGEPFSYWQDTLYTVRGVAARELVYRRTGLANGPVVELFSNPASTGARAPFPEERARHVVHYGLPVAEQADLVAGIRPQVLYGNRSDLTALADEISSRSSGSTIPGIFSTSETLLATDRDRLSEVFSASVRDIYGAAEVGMAAYQEQPEGPYVTLASRVLVEVLVDGRPAQPGESGEVVLTGLDNTVMPFIRYATGDLAVVHEAEPIVTLRRIEGRMIDRLVHADGSLVSPWHVSSSRFWGVPPVGDEVRHWQICQHEDRSVTVRLVPNRRDVEHAIRAEVRDHITGALGDLPVSVVVVEQIDAEPNGKFRPVRSAHGRG